MDKVLIVDDDPLFLDHLRNELQKYLSQFAAVTATNGAEAMAILEKERISVLVTDSDMPCRNGWDLLADMRRHRPHIPCIVMTTPVNPNIETTKEPSFIFRYIAKPFGADELFALIMEALEWIDEGLFWRDARNKSFPKPPAEKK